MGCYNVAKIRLKLTRVALLSALFFASPFYSNAQDQVGSTPSPQAVVSVDVSTIHATEAWADSVVEALQKKLQESDVKTVTIELTHVGDPTAFPKEAKWLIAHLKHAFAADTNRELKVEVKLVSVSNDDFAVRHQEASQAVEEYTSELALRSAELSDKTTALNELLTKLNLLNDTLDDAGSAFIRKFEKLKGNPKFSKFLESLSTSLTSSEILVQELQTPTNKNVPEIVRGIKENYANAAGATREFEKSLGEQERIIFKEYFGNLSVALGEIQITLEAIKTNFEDSMKVAFNLDYAGQQEAKEGSSTQEKKSLQQIIKELPQQTYQKFLYAKQKLATHLKVLSGLPKGVLWGMYNTKLYTERSPEDANARKLEIKLSYVQTFLVGATTFLMLHSKAVANPNVFLDVALSTGVAAGFKLLTANIGRMNTAFFRQGTSYDPFHKFTFNKGFFYLSAYVHSIIIGGLTQLAAYHTMSGEMLLHVAWHSFLGLFAKAAPQAWIATHQNTPGQMADSRSKNHSARKTVWINFWFDSVYQTIKAFHLFGLHTLNIDNVFIGLGLLGLAYETHVYFRAGEKGLPWRIRAKNNFKHAYHQLKGIFVKRERACKTLLSISTSTY